MATNTYSQNAILNLHMENATIEDVINSIEKQTDIISSTIKILWMKP